MKLISTIKRHPGYSIGVSICALLVFFSEVTPFLTGKGSLPELMAEFKEDVNINNIKTPDLKNKIKLSQPLVVNDGAVKGVGVISEKVDKLEIKTNVKNTNEEINPSSNKPRTTNIAECDYSLDSPLDCKL